MIFLSICRCQTFSCHGGIKADRQIQRLRRRWILLCVCGEACVQLYRVWVCVACTRAHAFREGGVFWGDAAHISNVQNRAKTVRRRSCTSSESPSFASRRKINVVPHKSKSNDQEAGGGGQGGGLSSRSSRRCGEGNVVKGG